MATTMKDIANRLNVSLSTVSYALNNGPRNVQPEMKALIEQTAREMDYRPNRAAKIMVTRRSHTIGVVFPELIESPFTSVYHQRVLNGFADTARLLKQDLHLYTSFSGGDTYQFVSMVANGGVDGVVFIAPHAYQSDFIREASKSIPCVVMSGVAPEGIATFGVDNEQGVHLAMEHLYNLGHRKIGHISGVQSMMDGRIRLDAYKEFLETKGLEVRPEWIGCGDFMIEKGREAARAIMGLDNPPTAFFCADDLMAQGALLAALELGIKVPEELSVAGFGMTPSSANTYPALTTVKHPVEDIASQAFEALVAKINGEPCLPMRDQGTELIIRFSTASPKEDKN